MKKRINVLFVLPSLGMGGAERQIIDLANGMSGELFNTYLFTFNKELDQLERLNREKVKFYNHPRKYKYDFSPSRQIAEIVNNENIDIIHCTNQISFLYGLMGKIKAKKKPKLITTIHTTINRNLKNEIFDRFLYAPLMLFCNVIITVCYNQRKHWNQKFPFLAKKFVTIHNGIDMNDFFDSMSEEKKKELKTSLGIKDEEFSTGIVAAFRPEKGHEYALRALKLITDSKRKAKLLLIGDGEKHNYLKSLGDRLSISKNIIWLGYKKDPRPYISICDAILSPSFAESFPYAIIEALAMGKIVIVTDVGGSSEIIRDGFNGFLIKPKDFASLAEIWNKIIDQEDLRKRLSINTRESVVKRFTISEMVSKTEGVFLNLIHYSSLTLVDHINP